MLVQRSEIIMLSMLLTALLMQAAEPPTEPVSGTDRRIAATRVEDRNEKTTPSEDELARMVCKSFAVTGSRAKRERVCMTNEQWIAHESRTRDEAGRLTNREGVCSNAAFCSGS
jgi:hypothetical protein